MTVLTPERTLPVAPPAPSPIVEAESNVVKEQVDAETQILIDAQKILKKSWCRGCRVKYEYGEYSYCAVGAIALVSTGDAHGLAPWQVLHRFTPYLGKEIGIVGYNDTTSKEKVLAMFDKAIRQDPV